MKRAYRQVLKFMRLAEDPIPDTPQMLPVSCWGENIAFRLETFIHDCFEVPPERGTKRMLWLLREIVEFLDAETPEDQVDALCDILVLTLGTFVEMRHNPDKAFNLVMQANFAKVLDAVSRDPDGYLRKPPGWAAPQPAIREEWERQVQCTDMFSARPCTFLRGISPSTMVTVLAEEEEEHDA